MKLASSQYYRPENSIVTNSDQGIRGVLQKYWGYPDFLPLQEEAMQCVLGGRDSVVVLPTGGGKSLCFQAPAMMLPGLALVVSPLISLMKDQVDALEENGIAAARLDSSQPSDVQSAIRARISAGQLKLLYVSPERLVLDGFLATLRRTAVSLVAIDEAHCISMWGHDFRGEYRQLGVLKEALPGVAVHAYTATATDQVREDIARQLRLNDPRFLVGQFDRPNLTYKVYRRENVLDQVREILDRHRDESGIVYCIRRADVDDLCDALKDKGHRVAAYHAGMTDIDRKQNQEAFAEERVQTIVATVAFGMGIDKSNVRYVVHTGMPKSLEHYQQETGRAGRDGLEAECCLLYSGGDYGTWKSMLREMPPEALEIALEKLNRMYDYAVGVTCRHARLVNYFGQDLGKDNCAACDVCLGELDCVEDSLVTAQKILSCVVRLKQGFGAEYTTAVLMGSKGERIVRSGHDRLSTYGLLADQEKRVVRDWVEQLVGQDCLRKTGEYNVLGVTEKGWRVLRGQETPRLVKPAKRRRETGRVERESWEGVDRELFDALRKIRSKIAAEKNVPPYVVFSDATLRDMARRMPSTAESFLRVHGVGQMKCQQYAETFLPVIAGHCRDRSLAMDAEPPVEAADVRPRAEARSGSTRPNPAKQKAMSLFAEGRSIDEVAQLTGRAVSTTLGYLAEYVEQEQLQSPGPWVDEAAFRRIAEAVRQTGGGPLKPIFDYLGGDVPYELIRISVACLRHQAGQGN
jgi:ATP-dependent DNA helicase RecQ